MISFYVTLAEGLGVACGKKVEIKNLEFFSLEHSSATLVECPQKVIRMSCFLT